MSNASPLKELSQKIAEAIGGRSKALAFEKTSEGRFKRTTLQSWIDGKTWPDASEMILLAIELNLPVNHFFSIPTHQEEASPPDCESEFEPTSPLREVDLYVPCLRLLTQAPGGFLSTSAIVTGLTEVFNPQGADAQILKGRKDTRFSQKIRNMISHRGTPTNIVALGYADYINDGIKGLKITRAGQNFLKNLSGE